MADDREPGRKKMDKRVLVWSAIIAVVVLVLFLYYDIGWRTAPDSTSGGPDVLYSAPPGPEETQPETTQEQPDTPQEN